MGTEWQLDGKSNPLIIYETAKSKQQVASGEGEAGSALELVWTLLVQSLSLSPRRDGAHMWPAKFSINLVCSNRD